MFLFLPLVRIDALLLCAATSGANDNIQQSSTAPKAKVVQ
jgi:hypothetical protein